MTYGNGVGEEPDSRPPPWAGVEMAARVAVPWRHR
jgi:hypothetical protein